MYPLKINWRAEFANFDNCEFIVSTHESSEARPTNSNASSLLLTVRSGYVKEKSKLFIMGRMLHKYGTAFLNCIVIATSNFAM